MSYSIEEHESEWIVYADGVAVLRCAEMKIAFEIVNVARERLVQSDPPCPVRPERSPPLVPDGKEEVTTDLPQCLHDPQTP